MYNIIIHAAVREGLIKLSDKLRTRLLVLIERLSVGVMSEHITREGDVFALRIGDSLVSRTLYARLEHNKLFLLFLISGRDRISASAIIKEIENKRRESTKLLPFSQLELKEDLLGSEEVMLCYQEAILEYSLQQLMREVNQHTGVTREQIAMRLNISVPAVARIEKSPLSVSIRNVARYMAASSVELDIQLKHPEV